MKWMPVSSALIIKELSYGDTGISTSAMCNDLANVVIAQHGTDEQKEAFLEPFVEAPLLASFCLTEPGAGSDNSAMTTFIQKRRRRLCSQRGQVFHHQRLLCLAVHRLLQGGETDGPISWPA